MKSYERNFYLKAALFFAIFNLAAFIVYHILVNVITASWTAYVTPLFTKTVKIIPILALGMLIAVCGTTEGGKRPFLYAVFIALTQILYVTPYLYLYYIKQGYDSIESLVMGLIGAILEVIVYYGIAVALSFVIRQIPRLLGKTFDGELNACGPFDFENGVCIASFAAAALGFLYLFVMELIDTASFFIDYGSSYTVGEIFYICICFTVDLAALFIYHSVLVFIKNITLRKSNEK